MVGELIAAKTVVISSATYAKGLGAVLKYAFAQYQASKIDEAQEILIEEIAKGESVISDAAGVNDMVAITHRYFRAAAEGSARVNMRLLAKVVAGQVFDGSLSSNTFLQYADVIASLTVNEIVLLGTFYTCFQQRGAEGKADAAQYATQFVLRKLTPKPFETKNEIMATAHAITRTGFLLPHPGAIGGPVFETTILFDKLYRLANFQDALRDEGMVATD